MFGQTIIKVLHTIEKCKTAGIKTDFQFYVIAGFCATLITIGLAGKTTQTDPLSPS